MESFGWVYTVGEQMVSLPPMPGTVTYLKDGIDFALTDWLTLRIAGQHDHRHERCCRPLLFTLSARGVQAAVSNAFPCGIPPSATCRARPEHRPPKLPTRQCRKYVRPPKRNERTVPDRFLCLEPSGVYAMPRKIKAQAIKRTARIARKDPSPFLSGFIWRAGRSRRADISPLSRPPRSKG